MAQSVFDNPHVGANFEFDEFTTLGGQAFQLPATLGEATATGFAGTLVTGFVGQATLGELETTGYNGGLVSGNSLNAQMGELTVTGGWPGSQAKVNGIHYFATDADGDPISFEYFGEALHGTVTFEFNGAFLYVPNRGFSGQDDFQWRPFAGGQFGPVYGVFITVAPERQALTGEANVIGFAPTMGGAGLDSPAETGELEVIGFPSIQLEAGFVGQALVGELETTGFQSGFEGTLQALTGELTVTGFAGVTVAGWINRADTGVALDVTGLLPTVNSGLNSQAQAADLTVTGFAPLSLEVPHGFEFPATLGQLTVTGYAGALTAALIAQIGIAGTITGFAPTLDITVPPFVWSPQAPTIPFYDPRNHLPDGRTLDRELEDDLMVYWESVGRRILTAGEISVIVGSPLPTPVIRREFGTGAYPVRKIA